MGTQPAPSDQQNLQQTMVFGGILGPLNVAALKAQVGPANVYQFSKDFQFVFNKHICSFRHGEVYALDAALKAALIAASAPMTQL
jgi:hypothetical protein